MPPDEGQSRDHSAVSVYNDRGVGGMLLVCEHASNFIPKSFERLGLVPELLNSHIAWDPGAFELAKLLSASLDCPLVASNVSRLVYDSNRPPNAVDAIPARSERYDIPGNQNLSPTEKSARVNSYYRPFETAITDLLQRRSDIFALVTIHSFTPIYNGKRRKVEMGILHDEDERLADMLLELAPRYTKLVTHRNQPYGREDGVTHTLQCHGVANGLLNVMLEIRNDLISVPVQQNTLASMLHSLLGAAVNEARHLENQTGTVV